MPLVTGKVMGNASQQHVITVPDTFPWGSMNLVAANQNSVASAIQIDSVEMLGQLIAFAEHPVYWRVPLPSTPGDTGLSSGHA